MFKSNVNLKVRIRFQHNLIIRINRLKTLLIPVHQSFPKTETRETLLQPTLQGFLTDTFLFLTFYLEAKSQLTLHRCSRPRQYEFYYKYLIFRQLM
jgi:hypothetical protein